MKKKAIIQVKSEIMRFRRIKFDKVNRILVIVMTMFMLIGAVGYKITERRTKQSLVEQMLDREQVVSRAGARSMEKFLEDLANSLQVLSTDSQINGGAVAAQLRLEKFITSWTDTPVQSVVLTDKQGVVISNANNLELPIQLGTELKDREHFQWAKEAGSNEVYLSKPVMARVGSIKGKYIIPVAASVRVGKEFKGMLSAPITIADLTKRYLDPLKISEETRIYFMNSDGVVLYSPLEKMIGVNYIEMLKERPFTGSEVAVEKFEEVLKKPENGELDISLRNEETGELTRYLIAYSPVFHNGEHCILAVATPVKDAMVFFQDFKTNLVSGVVFVFLWLMVLIMLMVLAWRLVQREAYEEGFKAGRRQE